MVQARTRAAVLNAFEDGVINTPQGAFIGSFSIAVVKVLLSSLASDVVPVSRREEVDARFLLAEPDAVLPEPWAHQMLPFRRPGNLPNVMEWRIPGLPSLFTFSSAWTAARPLHAGEGCSIASCVTGYRACDPTQTRIRNGVVYRKTYRGWRPVPDLNRSPVHLGSLLSLASLLGIEVENSLSWHLSRWVNAHVMDRSSHGTLRRSRKGLRSHSPRIAA